MDGLYFKRSDFLYDGKFQPLGCSKSSSKVDLEREAFQIRPESSGSSTQKYCLEGMWSWKPDYTYKDSVLLPLINLAHYIKAPMASFIIKPKII